MTVADSLRIVVLGYIVRGPLGGMAWQSMQYMLGLHQLGHDVIFMEESSIDPMGCYDPVRGVTDSDPSYGLAFADATLSRIGLGERWAYFDAHRQHWHGPRAADAPRLAAEADLVLNLSGVNAIAPWFTRAPIRAYVDTDPVFTQIRHLTDPGRRLLAQAHNVFFTIGENFGTTLGDIPDDGFPWQPTREPIVLDAWPVTPPPDGGRYTTVMQWDSYPPAEYDGKRFGMKSEAFGPYIDVARQSPRPLELAIGSANVPREELLQRGWLVVNPLGPTRDPWTYQQYIAGSRGEFTVAKHGYVVSRSGWFSERSASYLASGRPAIVQDTAFSTHIPTGEGLLAFSSPEEAIEALQAVEARYEHHARAAREIAEQYFDSRRVLTSLIETAMRGGGSQW